MVTTESVTQQDSAHRDERSIIVVSDLHLGGNEDHGTMARFCDFLNTIDPPGKTLPDIADKRKDIDRCPDNSLREKDQTNETATAPQNDFPKTLFRPEKIILLGDFLEFWDSKNQDRDNVLFDALFPLLRLRDMDCDTVYVTGNHDEELWDLIESGACLRDEDGETARKFWGLKTKPLFENQDSGKNLHGLSIHWSESHWLHIHSRAYAPPAEDGKYGIEKGGITYSFLHGHQFDKEQVTGTLDEGFSRLGAWFRCDIIDYFEDIANISAAKSINPYVVALLSFVTLFLAVLFWNQNTNAMSFIGATFGFVLVLVFLGMILLFGNIARDLPSSAIVAWLSCVGFFVLVLLIIAGFLTNHIQVVTLPLFVILLALSAYITVVIVVPCMIAYGKRWMYNNLFKTEAGTIAAILNGGSVHFDRFSHRSEVLVFGHTHKPDILMVRDYLVANQKGEDEKKWTWSVRNIKAALRRQPEESEIIPPVYFINTGSWVSDPAQETSGQCCEGIDTFVYIDSLGVSLMKWYGKGMIGCLSHISTGTLNREKQKLQDTLKDIRKTTD